MDDWHRRDVLKRTAALGAGTLALTRTTSVRAAPGEQQWAFETGDLITSSPTVVEGTVFVGSDDHTLYAVDAGVSGSSEGSRVMLGTLGHHGQSHPGEPYRGELADPSDYRAETPREGPGTSPGDPPTEDTERPSNTAGGQGQRENPGTQRTSREGNGNGNGDGNGGIPGLNRLGGSGGALGLGLGLIGVLGGGGYLAFRGRDGE